MTATRPAELLRLVDQDTPDDAELFSRFRRGDQGAFAVLVRRHGPLVLAVCRRIANQDAEDAFQATFLTLVRRADSIREPRLIGNWLYGAALRVSKRAKRSAMRRRVREVQAVNSPDPPAPDVRVPFEHEAAIHDEIAKLPEAVREAVVLCEFRGVSRSEAAAMLGIPEGTLSSRLAAGRKKLADRLSRRGITLGAALISLAAVPEGLVASTCRIAAGAAVPAAIERLMSGGFPMRTVLIGVLGFGLATVGAVLSARPVEPPLVKEQPTGPQTKAEAKTEAKGETVFKPRLSKTMDLSYSVTRLVWSPDGKWFVASARTSEQRERILFVSQTTPAQSEMVLLSNQKLQGITPDSKHVVTDLRESGLLSGLHAVRLWHINSDRSGPMEGPGGFGTRFQSSKEHVLDPECMQQYGFPAGGETIRTLHTRKAKLGVINHVEVFEAKLGEAAAKSAFKADDECDWVVLSPSGNKVALLNKTSLTVHDIAAGKKTTFEKLPAAEPPIAENDARRRTASFSPDESLVLTALIGRKPVILSLNGADPVALDGVEKLTVGTAGASFSPDRRLVAMSATRYGLREVPFGGTLGGGGGSRKTEGPIGSDLMVWDVRTGRIVKSWPFDVKAVFHPLKSTLSIFEPAPNGTRIGFWDFVEEQK